MNHDLSTIVFQSAVSAPSNGNVFPVGDFKTLTLEIYGTSTTQTIIFEGASVSGTFYPVLGTRLSDLSMAAQTSGLSELWQFDVTGLQYFRARVSAVAGGNITINGNAVD